MQPSVWQLLIVAALVVLLFGRGKISAVMGDVAKGINSFKKGLSEKDEDVAAIDAKTGEPVEVHTERSKVS